MDNKKIMSKVQDMGALIALILLVIVIGVISPEFRTIDNFMSLMRQSSINGFIAFGMTCVILTDAIAAVALGGTSMSGGRGRIWGTFVGVLIIAVLNNGLNILGVSSYYQDVIKGIVILIAVLSDSKR